MRNAEVVIELSEAEIPSLTPGTEVYIDQAGMVGSWRAIIASSPEVQGDGTIRFDYRSWFDASGREAFQWRPGTRIGLIKNLWIEVEALQRRVAQLEQRTGTLIPPG